MKEVSIKYGLSNGEFDINGLFGPNVKFSGFDFNAIKQFGAFLCGMCGADKLILEQDCGEEGSGCCVIDLNTDEAKELLEEEEYEEINDEMLDKSVAKHAEFDE